MNEYEYIVGTLEGIEEKNSGWSNLKINVGRQYPVTLTTKKAELVDAARAARGSEATWKYVLKVSDRRNERSGDFFIDRYFEAVKEGSHIPEGYVSGEDEAKAKAKGGGSGGGSSGGSRSSSGGDDERGLSKEEWRAKDSASDLRACIAIAAGALQGTVPSSPSMDELNKYNARVLHLATAWHRVVSKERDQEPLPSEGGAEPPPDDDIPF